MHQESSNASRGPDTPALTQQFWCPACHDGALHPEAGAMRCAACAQAYPVRRGTPVLIVDERSVFTRDDFTDSSMYEGAAYGTHIDSTHGLRSGYRQLMRFLKDWGTASASTSSSAAITEVCRQRSRPRILVIGAGVVRFDQAADFTYTDVSFSDGIACLADAHDLPFADASFDMVVAVAVLEHVADPQRVEAEMRRVLVHDGWVYAATPFLQPVHMGAYDFTRFTHLGHRRLFRHYSEIDSGPALGPGWVLGSAWHSFLVSFSRGRWSRRLLNLAGTLLSIPWRWLDPLTLRTPAGSDAAGSVYFFGRRAAQPISDRELIGLYRGGG
ncbi:methyltransferase domain-containing protein [Alicycliphilus denitrificans]|uniref:methyltransferase domain-containing protein n=1 Tax=Alicycliphilus denitrificans TaxID=179636 RepID=UPI00384E9069